MSYIRSFKSGDGLAIYFVMTIVLILFCFITWQAYKPLPDEISTQLFSKAISIAKTPDDLEKIPEMFKTEPPDWEVIAGQLGTLFGLCMTLLKFSQSKSAEKVEHVKAIKQAN